MTIDRDALAAAAGTPPHPSGPRSAAITRSLHRDPATREWVTVESEPVLPVPLLTADQRGLGCLLAVRGERGFKRPWAALAWSFPDGQLMQTCDLRQLPPSLPDAVPDPLASCPPAERTERERELFAALDQALAEPTPNLRDLLGLYQRLLSAEAIACYHVVFPETRTWLQPSPGQTIPGQTIPGQTIPGQTILGQTTQGGPPGAIARDEQPRATPAVGGAPGVLGERLGEWLRQTRKLAETVECRPVIQHLDRLTTRRQVAGFRLAVVGEFNTGKSSLIAALLERPGLLPVGDIATTAIITSIVPGSVERLDARLADGRIDERPLVADSWRDLLATDERGRSRDVIAQARVVLDNPWLREMDIELVDTPGTADVDDRHAALTLEAVEHCDAALLVVSGTRPFAMSEEAFLEEDVLRRGGIPKVAVVVSKLDVIPEAKRAIVLDNVRGKVAAVSSEIPVFPGPLPQSAQPAQALRQHIAAMSAPGERHRLRSIQVARQLTLDLIELLSVCLVGQEQAGRDAAARARAQRDFEAELVRGDTRWMQMKTELLARQQRAVQMTRTLLQRAEADAIEIFTREAEIVPDPKLWWERDLPFRLRREMLAVQSQVEHALTPLITADRRWMQQALTAAYSREATGAVTPSLAGIDEPAGPPDMQLRDIRRLQLYTRLGTGAAIIGVALLAGPFAMIASVVAGIANERFITLNLQDQRPKMQGVLAGHLRQVFSRLADQVADRVATIYRSGEEAARFQLDGWKQLQRDAYDKQAPPDSGWQGISKQINDLRTEINAVVGGGMRIRESA